MSAMPSFLPEAGYRSSMLSLDAAGATSVGCVRSSNQDAIFVGTRVFGVADGMGGHAAGEVASALAVEELRKLDRRATIQPADVTDAITSANQVILASASEDPSRDGMGTTLVGLAHVHDDGSDHWTVFNVGDSRIYRHAGDEFGLISVDHSEVQELVQRGAITAAEARVHPMKNVITRALGSEGEHGPDTWLFSPVAGESFLICSDGLSNEVDDERIAQVLARPTSAQEVADTLVADAERAGGHDNISVVVVRVLAA